MDLESLDLGAEPLAAPAEGEPPADDGGMADIESFIGTDDPDEVDAFVRAVKAAFSRP